MAEKFRFFDSIEGSDERFYTADEFAEYFRLFIRDGIFNGGENLNVGTDGVDLKTFIKPGYAWIEGYLYKIDTENLYLEHDTPDPALNRIDRVVIRLDKSLESRFVKAFILKGTPAATPAAPELTRTDNLYEISLAEVNIIAGKSFIEAYQITDERVDNEVCGLVTHLFEQVNTTEIYNRFEAWMDEKTAEPDGDFFQEWQAWFSEIQDTTNLVSMTQFNALKTRLATYPTAGGTANALTVPQNGFSLVHGAKAWFKAAVDNTGTVTVDVESTGVFALKDIDGANLTAGDLTTGYFYEIVWDAAQSFFYLAPKGGKPRKGHVAGQSVSANGTQLRIRPQKGFYKGDADNSVAWTDNNWVEANILKDVVMFGKTGTAIKTMQKNYIGSTDWWSYIGYLTALTQNGYMLGSVSGGSNTMYSGNMATGAINSGSNSSVMSSPSNSGFMGIGGNVGHCWLWNGSSEPIVRFSTTPSVLGYNYLSQYAGNVTSMRAANGSGAFISGNSPAYLYNNGTYIGQVNVGYNVICDGSYYYYGDNSGYVHKLSCTSMSDTSVNANYYGLQPIYSDATYVYFLASYGSSQYVLKRLKSNMTSVSVTVLATYCPDLCPAGASITSINVYGLNPNGSRYVIILPTLTYSAHSTQRYGKLSVIDITTGALVMYLPQDIQGNYYSNGNTQRNEMNDLHNNGTIYGIEYCGTGKPYTLL